MGHTPGGLLFSEWLVKNGYSPQLTKSDEVGYGGLVRRKIDTTIAVERLTRISILAFSCGQRELYAYFDNPLHLNSLTPDLV